MPRPPLPVLLLLALGVGVGAWLLARPGGEPTLGTSSGGAGAPRPTRAPAPPAPRPAAAPPAQPLDPGADPRLAKVVTLQAEKDGAQAGLQALDAEPLLQGERGEAQAERRRLLEGQLDTSERLLAMALPPLVEGLRGEPALVEAVAARLLRASAGEALVLGQALRAAPGDELVARLAGLARSGASPHVREAALVALEGRDAASWLGPTRAAFLEDPAPEVRERAAQLLGRRLGNPFHGSSHAEVRAALVVGLDDADAAQRRRAVRAFQRDSAAPEDVRARLQRLQRDDPDPGVRQEVEAVLRAWNAAPR